MKTVIILYLPGHAGNFVARLFSLGQETMPLLEKTMLQSSLESSQEISDDFDRLENYRFSSVPTRFDNWQQFHRSFADYKEYSSYRLLNLFCKRKYSRIVFPLHPHELVADFNNQSGPEFYYVDLDIDQWGTWVNEQQTKLNFQYRPNEHEQFHNLKETHNMKSISLNHMLHSQRSFLTEYHRVCDVMNISANIDQALHLRDDWMAVRGQ
jgi:alpha-L-arabinofuranosidase